MAPINRLTAKQVEKIKAAGDYCDGGGLYLQVSGKSAKSWIFRLSFGMNVLRVLKRSSTWNKWE